MTKEKYIKAKATKIKVFLKAKRHATATVNAMDFSDDNKGLDALLKAHKITPEQWDMAG